jgi:hypothetical protein
MKSLPSQHKHDAEIEILVFGIQVLRSNFTSQVLLSVRPNNLAAVGS